MEKTMKNEAMIEPIEEVIGAVANLEEKPKNMEIIEVKSENEAKPIVAVVSTMNEGFTGTKGAVKPRSSLDVTDRRSVKSTDDESPDFKSIVKTPLEPKKKTKKATKKRRKCKKGYRRNKRTHRCRKKKTE